MKISLRGWFVVGAFTAFAVVLALLSSPLVNAQTAPRSAKRAQLSEESLGKLIEAVGFQPTKQAQRYDFQFKAKHQEQEWELSMSAVLSENGEAVWVMAWLDELPRSAAEVPRTALLRLLANNDRLGNGKFFAYVAGNRRFVLQRVIPNENISIASFRRVLQDLGYSVAETHPHWNVANWSGNTSTAGTDRNEQTTPAANSAAAPSSRPQGSGGPTQSAVNDSKFRVPRRN